MPAVGNIYQVTYNMRLNGQICENVVHYRELTGLSTPAQIRTSAEKYLTLFATGISNEVVFTSIIIKQMTPLALDETVGPPVTTTQGANSSPAINNTLALILTKRTGVAGKSHRGRLYICGIPASQADEVGLNLPGVGVWTGQVAGLMAVFGPTGTDTHLQIGVYSRSIGGFNPFTVPGWQAITSLDIQPVFGNQRRRRVGVGI
jgi:hypothetical protein